MQRDSLAIIIEDTHNINISDFISFLSSFVSIYNRFMICQYGYKAKSEKLYIDSIDSGSFILNVIRIISIKYIKDTVMIRFNEYLNQRFQMFLNQSYIQYMDNIEIKDLHHVISKCKSGISFEAKTDHCSGNKFSYPIDQVRLIADRMTIMHQSKTKKIIFHSKVNLYWDQLASSMKSSSIDRGKILSISSSRVRVYCPVEIKSYIVSGKINPSNKVYLVDVDAEYSDNKLISYSIRMLYD